MLTLTLDCSFGGLSLGLFQPNGTCLMAEEKPESRSTTHLATLLQNMLQTTGQTAADIDTVVTTVGPGSFTGIRLGLAAAEALRLAHPATRLVGLSTLQAVAQTVGGGTILLDAAGGMVYHQVFSSAAEPLSPPVCERPENLPLATATPLHVGPGLLLAEGGTPFQTISPQAMGALAANAANHAPLAPHYVKPLTYKPQHAAS